MPKITFITNIDDEIIYPKTHIDAILSDDGYTLPEKFENLKTKIDEKSDNGHKHSYNDLLDKPNSFEADGGNCDTINNKTVNDSKLGTEYLWTSQRIYDEIIKQCNKIQGNVSDTVRIPISETAPENSTIWIDSVNNVLKYKVNDNWKNLTFNISFVEN